MLFFQRKMLYKPTIANIKEASKLLRKVFDPTPLQFSKELSLRHDAKIFLKREDLTPVRSYKIRGAFVKMNALLKSGSVKSVVTCSAGNHAQGVAFSCDGSDGCGGSGDSSGGCGGSGGYAASAAASAGCGGSGCGDDDGHRRPGTCRPCQA